MNRLLFAILFAIPCFAFAQEKTDSISTEKNIELCEVSINADRVVKTADGLKVFPTAEQLSSSADGYNLLRRLSLPQIRIDEVLHTIKANDIIGAVQVRINDVVASEHDLMSLDMNSIKSFDYIQQPGLRYGEGIGIVININTTQAEKGYIVGGSFLEAVTSLFNRSSAYAKLNKNKHEFSINYSFDLSDWGKDYSTETTDYILNDGSTYSVDRYDKANKSRTLNNGLTLKYSLAEPEKYNLQIALSSAFENTPTSSMTRSETINSAITNDINIENKSHSSTPQFDIYFNLNLPSNQSITANAVGSYQAESYDYLYASSSPYAYGVNSHIYSFASEAIYEKRWKPLTLSLGGKYKLLHSSDDYTGDILTSNRLNRSQAYVFSQLSGTVGNFAFKGGLGYDGIWYKQNGRRYNFNQVIPKASVTYFPCKALSIIYAFSIQQMAPRLALINDITTKLNDMEYQQGNPSISPRARYEQELSINLQTKRVQSYLFAIYRLNPNTWMEKITRTDDNKFIFTKGNIGDCNMLYISDMTTINILPGKLDLSLQASFVRDFNFADSYTHCYSALMGGFDIQAYLGKFTITAHADNGYKFMEGERKSANGATTYITSSYRLGKWGSINLIWQNIFNKDYATNRLWLMNENLKKTATYYSPNLGNMIAVRLSINISRGRKYRSIEKTLNNNDIESTSVRTK